VEIWVPYGIGVPIAGYIREDGVQYKEPRESRMYRTQWHDLHQPQGRQISDTEPTSSVRNTTGSKGICLMNSEPNASRLSGKSSTIKRLAPREIQSIDVLQHFTCFNRY